MAQWFVVRDGKEHGPLTPQKLKELASTGRLRATDLVRQEDMTAARPAGQIRRLFPSSGTTAGPPTPPPPPRRSPSPPAVPAAFSVEIEPAPVKSNVGAEIQWKAIAKVAFPIVVLVVVAAKAGLKWQTRHRTEPAAAVAAPTVPFGLAEVHPPADDAQASLQRILSQVAVIDTAEEIVSAEDVSVEAYENTLSDLIEAYRTMGRDLDVVTRLTQQMPTASFTAADHEERKEILEALSRTRTLLPSLLGCLERISASDDPVVINANWTTYWQGSEEFDRFWPDEQPSP